MNSATTRRPGHRRPYTFCGSEPAGTYTVRATGFYESPRGPDPVRAARRPRSRSARRPRAPRSPAKPLGHGRYRLATPVREESRAGVRPGERRPGPARAAGRTGSGSRSAASAHHRPRPRRGPDRRPPRPAGARRRTRRATTSPARPPGGHALRPSRRGQLLAANGPSAPVPADRRRPARVLPLASRGEPASIPVSAHLHGDPPCRSHVRAPSGARGCSWSRLAVVAGEVALPGPSVAPGVDRRGRRRRRPTTAASGRPSARSWAATFVPGSGAARAPGASRARCRGASRPAPRPAPWRASPTASGTPPPSTSAQCRALHRRGSPQVNYCASQPDRSARRRP